MVYRSNDLGKMLLGILQSNIVVMLLCIGSKSQLLQVGPSKTESLVDFNTVAIYDFQARS